jgi:hypothetical protein
MSSAPFFPLFYQPTNFENMPTNVALLFLLCQQLMVLTFV